MDSWRQRNMTYSKTPEEEEDGDQGDGQDGLLDGQGRRAGQALVGDVLAVLLRRRLGRAGPALVEDLGDIWFLSLAEHCGGCGDRSRKFWTVVGGGGGGWKSPRKKRGR